MTEVIVSESAEASGSKSRCFVLGATTLRRRTA